MYVIVLMSSVGEWALVIRGVIFVTCVLLLRRGIAGELANKLHHKH